MSQTCPKCHCAKVLGVEVMGVYDGVCYWTCGTCGHSWHRFDKNDPRRKKLDALGSLTAQIAERPEPT